MFKTQNQMRHFYIKIIQQDFEKGDITMLDIANVRVRLTSLRVVWWRRLLSKLGFCVKML